jgi:O-antigen ligase
MTAGGSVRALSPEARLDIAGIALVVGTAGWFQLSAANQGADAAPAIALLAVSTVGYVVALASGRLLSPLVPVVFMVAAAATALVATSGPRAPLGYENANGIFFVLAAVAAMTVWATAPRHVLGVAALSGGIFFGVIPMVNEVLTATLAFAFVVVVAAAAHLGRMRGAVAASAAAFVVVLLGTVVLGLTYEGQATRLSSALTERRLELWHDALVIVGEHPVAGAGFSRFEELSPTARSDRDARWAHNEFLQVGAETGIPGLVLVVSLFVWGFARLAIGAESMGRALAAAGLAAVGIAASVDYVFHFAAVPITAAVLLGAGVAAEPNSRRRQTAE